MATKNLQKEELTSEQKIIGQVSTFFEKNRKLIIIAAIVIVVAIVGAIVAINVANSSKAKAQIKIASLEQRYGELILEENPDFSTLTSDLESMVKGSSYPSVKAAYLLGLVNYEQKNYSAAQSYFEKAYELNSKIYLASVSLINAAACAEDQGNTTKALELYNQVSSDYPESGVAAKALFNAARIYMQQGNTQLAQASFAQVATSYPNSEYGKLAKNLATVL